MCFKKKFDRAIQLAHPVEEVDVFDGMCGSDCSIEKMGSKRHFFDCVRICPIWSPIGKSPFSIHRSDCIRVGLTFLLFIFLLFVVFLAQFVVFFFVFSFSYPYVHLLLVVFCLFFFPLLISFFSVCFLLICFFFAPSDLFLVFLFLLILYIPRLFSCFRGSLVS